MSDDAHAERQQRILGVAGRHFAGQPYEQVSTVAIAKDAQVNRGWIYHEFGSKRELYRAVLRNNVRIPSLLPVGARTIDPSDLKAVVSEIVDAWLDEVEANREAYLVMHQVNVGSLQDPVVLGVLRELHQETIDNALSTILTDMDTDRPEARAIVTAFGAFAWQLLWEWLQSGRLDRRRVHFVLTESVTTFFHFLPKVIA